jgi:DNA-binding transcriptional LysR family regulator
MTAARHTADTRTGVPGAVPSGRLVELVLVRSFVAIAQTGSYAHAAKQLGYAQPTLSGHIKALERALGRPLLVRDGSGTSLSPQGRRFLAHAQDILEAVALAVAALDEPAARPRVPVSRPVAESA